jgi:AcrR family transcriptional regulator
MVRSAAPAVHREEANVREQPNAREVILDTAAHIVAEEGVKRLTIEHVASAARLSRGGVLYHFPSKDALIEGLVRRLVDQFQQSLDAAVAADPEPRGRFTRAYARLTLARADDTSTRPGAAMGGLLASLAYNPGLLAPFHERLLAWQRRSEQELDAATAAIVRLAAHALWTNELLLPNAIDATLLRAVVLRLEALTRE